MKRAFMIWLGCVLAMIGLGAVVSIFQSHNVIGGPILAGLFLAAAWRVWIKAGDAQSPQH